MIASGAQCRRNTSGPAAKCLSISLSIVCVEVGAPFHPAPAIASKFRVRKASFEQALGTDPAYGPDDFGNYLVFKGFTGGVVTITATNFIGGGAPRAPINGIQIVAQTAD